jgi:hypothetical protein
VKYCSEKNIIFVLRRASFFKGLPDKTVKGDQQRIILAKLGPVVLEGKKLKCHPPFFYF